MVAHRIFASPIEVMFRNALCHSVRDSEFSLTDLSMAIGHPRLERSNRLFTVDEDEIEYPDSKYVNWPGGETYLTLYGQVLYKSYKFDFTVIIDGVPLVLECDGHDWHDRTKQQAAYDRSRDRELAIDGIYVLRFTGSEITHSAERCVADVWAMASRLHREELRGLDIFDHGLKRGREIERGDVMPAKEI